MNSITPSPHRARRRSEESSVVLVSSRLAAVPPRVLGHAVVVVLCLAVAYAGRASNLAGSTGSWSVQRAMFQPSAFAFPEASSPDTLVRPPMTNTADASSQRLQIMHYDTQPGDTVNSLSNKFDISENTILWANSLAPDQQLSPGQQVTILPVSGVLYTARSGDSLDEIARRFQSDAGSIAEFNQISVSAPIATGAQLVIPGGRIEDLTRPDLSSRSFTRPDRTGMGSAVTENPAPSLASPSQLIAPGSDAGATGTSDHIPFKARRQIAVVKPLAPVVYHVVDGDTLSSIAQHFGVSEASIAAASGLQGSEDALSVNQKLLIPPVPGVLHVVQTGDTLQAIADRYAADPNAIARANGLKDPFTLQVGQTLVVPGGKVPEVVPAAPTAPRTSYTVTEGDSVSSIANAFGIDMQSIIQANGLSDPYMLQQGQTIVIPGVNAAPSIPAAAPHTTYTVQQGDSLSQIADSFGVDLNKLVGMNSLSDPANLQPGQQIIIPGAGRVVVPSRPAAAPVIPAPAPRPRVVVAQAAPPPARSSGNAGWSVVAVASRFLGTPYVWGGTSPGGFDCSGLVWYAYQHAGVPIPRDMWGQLQSGSRVSRSNLRPGDIVFFGGTYEAGLSHDGIYIGGGRFVDAVDYGIGVAVSNLNDAYWSSHYYGATRPW
ncbi:MAG: LysM peptidoglycan-binding domain-containing protein [Chloroflexota bacterium]